MTMTGRRIADRYELLEPVGSGGMATVWRARDLRLGRTVAVKLLRPQYAEDERFVERFESEARHAASLAHPNIAPVHDTGMDGDERYIVMEFVDGPSVAEILDQRGRLPPFEAAALAAAAARGLAAAHRRGIVHRDVKPGNLLLGRDGRLRVVDFGIARALTTARVTATGLVLGSVPYLSPEQARGEEATASSDLFSLGIVLYEMLTGRVPWSSDTPAATALARLVEDAPAPSALVEDLPPGLDAIVARALAADPADRYPSARAFADALEAWRRRWPSLAAAVAGAALPEAMASLPDPAELGPAAVDGDADQLDDGAVDGMVDAGAGAIPAAETVARAIARPNPDAEEGVVPTGSPPLAVGRSRPAATRRWTAAAAGQATGPRSRRRRAAPALVAFLALAVLLLTGAALSWVVGGSVGGGVLGATATPDVAIGPVLTPSPIATPSTVPTERPTPTPAPTATAPPTPATTPLPTPRATVRLTPPPTPRPTPRTTPRPPTTAPTTGSPAAAVRAFYDAVEAHAFDRAAALWTAEMRQRYPPSQYIDGRFAPTTRIELPRLETVTRSDRTARVAVTIVESRRDQSTPRRYEGAWDLVRRDGRWLLADPDLRQTA